MITVKANVRDLQRIEKMLKNLPKGAKSIVVPAVSEYLIGDESHGLKHEPAYNYVDRTSAYGFPFFTDKQRRYFFWALGEGIINPGRNNRTHEAQDGWKTRGDLYRQQIYNDAPHAKWLYSDRDQARQPAKVGWRKISEIIASNMKGAIRHARMKLNEWLKKKGYR